MTIDRRSFLLRAKHLLLGAIGLSVLSPLARHASAAQIIVGSIVKVRGGASLLRDGQQIVLEGGEEVAARDVITTLADSRVRIALKDGSTLNLGELTRMTIAEFEFSAETMERKGAFDLKGGLLQAITAKAAPGSSFVIRTRNAVAATRSTDWIVNADKAETSVFVLEGKVDVAESALGFRSLSSAEQDKAMLLAAGQSVVIGKMALGAELKAQPSDNSKIAKLQAGLAFD
ncbi:FecR domain-containing protein [Dongia sp.]|uniref:FecR family protein n=1 Tax=Dongia sp. TaxID=1977262 RepID=UPI0035B02D47